MITFEEFTTTMVFQDVDGDGTNENIVDTLAGWTENDELITSGITFISLDDYIAAEKLTAA